MPNAAVFAAATDAAMHASTVSSQPQRCTSSVLVLCCALRGELELRRGAACSRLCCFLRVLGVTRASRQAKEDARAQALRGKWRKPKSCHDMFKGKQSLFSPACVPPKALCSLEASTAPLTFASLPGGAHPVPVRSPFMKNWDLLMALLLLFTATVTPFEVAFLETKVDVLFVLNRLIDSLFLAVRIHARVASGHLGNDGT